MSPEGTANGVINLETILTRLLAAKNNPITPDNISAEEIQALCALARGVFMSQPILLEVDAPVKICGDIHGQFKDLLRLFDLAKYPPYSNFLFLGDYVDRGKQSLETICLLLAYKIKYPQNFFMLRGNHEVARLNMKYGFFHECKYRYSEQLWKTIVEDCFNVLPVAAIVEGKIFCCHGGLSQHLQSLDQIRRLARPTDVPHEGLLRDLLWTDPSKESDTRGWRNNQTRKRSFEFGADVITEFLAKHDLNLIARAHQLKMNGYEFSADSPLVTVFSAPNYCGIHGNEGAVMCVDKDLSGYFQILKVRETS